MKTPSLLKAFLFTFAFAVVAPQAHAIRCAVLFQGSGTVQAKVHGLLEQMPEGWRLPAKGSLQYQRFLEAMPAAMRNSEMDTAGRWNKEQTAQPRLAVPVARFRAEDNLAMSKPREHVPLPSIDREGRLYYPEHVPVDAQGKAVASENFFVRMMLVKNKGEESLTLPPQLEYLRPFYEEAVRAEKIRDPEGFRDRYAYVQVDASWVEPKTVQPRPGKTTDQNPDPRNRQGSHVDGFLREEFWGMREDMTYSVSFGFNPKGDGLPGDNIPTEFFNVAFPIPRGLTHPEARVLFDKISNENLDQLVMLPAGVMNRMDARTIHRVGVAQRRTYRTFTKIKFSDAIFNQAENTVNVDAQGKPAELYGAWRDQRIPVVGRKTLPTEGVIEVEDRDTSRHNLFDPR